MRASQVFPAATLVLFLTSHTAVGQVAQGGQDPIRLTDIGDASIIKETGSLIQEAEKLLSDIQRKEFVRDRALDFNKIRPIRTKLSKRSLELRGLLENFRQYRTSLKAQLQQRESASQTKDDPDLSALIEIDADRMKRRTDQLREHAESLRTKLAASQNDDEKKRIRDELAAVELDVRRGTAETALLQRRKASAENTAKITQGEIENLKNSIGQIDVILDEGQSQLRRLDETLVTLDEVSASLLQTDILNINYTDRSTYIFGALVGAVIIGFFAIAFLSDEVRKAIFTGDSGIQFVTLFSLVIAIILFGVLKILEGKELAALLGGLSGYILGRGSGARAAQQGQSQGPPSPPTAAPAPAPTPAGAP
jgi:hypothetical protein